MGTTNLILINFELSTRACENILPVSTPNESIQLTQEVLNLQ